MSLAVCSLLATGCTDGESTDGPDTNDPGRVTTIPLDGLLLLSFKTPNDHIALLDPSTGKASPLYATRSADGVAISPDASRVAYLTASGVTLAKAVVTEEGPALSAESSFSNAEATLGGSSLRWTPDGRWLVYNEGAIDPETGVRYPCPNRESPTLIPGSHDLTCSGDRSLRRDGHVLATLADGIASADGQLLSSGTHVITGAQPVSAPTTYAGARIALPNGAFAQFTGGVHGKYIVAEPAGFVTLYRIEENLAPPADGVVHSTGLEVDTSASPDDSWRWPVADALLPWFTEGDGRGYGYLGMSPDGQEIFYAVTSYVITYPSDIPATSPVDAVVVAIARDGTSRAVPLADFGLRTIGGSGLPEPGKQQDFIPEHLKPLLTMQIGEDDVLVVTDLGINGRPESWVGWRDGAPWVGARLGVPSPDGRDFAVVVDGVGIDPSRLCVTPGGRVAQTRCLRSEYDFRHARMLGFIGMDTDPRYADDGPRIFATSRAAAPAQDAVEIFGVRFGDDGILRVGDVVVPDSAIVSWTDRRIEFVVDETLPVSGVLSVATDDGDTAGQRAFWLHRTERLRSPFDNVPTARVSLRQGLNPVDLGSLNEFEFRLPDGGDRPLLKPTFRDDDGTLYLYSDGASVAIDGSARLVAGDYSRLFLFRREPGLADSTRWQPVSLESRQPGAPIALLATLGELENVGSNRQFFRAEAQRIRAITPSEQRDAPFWRPVDDGGGIWRVRHNRGYPSRLLLQTAWQTIDAPSDVRPEYADGVTVLPVGLSAVAQAGDVMIATGSVGNVGAYAMSNDGGATFGEVITTPTVPGQLREPIRIDAATGPFFLVFSSPANAPGLTGVHAVSLQGAFTPVVADVPNGQLGGGLARDVVPLSYAQRNGELLVYFAQTKVLVYADFSSFSPTAPVTGWTLVPGSASEERVVSTYFDEPSGVFYAILDDGTIQSAGDNWSDWTTEDFGFDLALPTRVAPRALGRLPDGRWLVNANLYDARAGATMDTPSPLRAEAYLVSPP